VDNVRAWHDRDTQEALRSSIVFSLMIGVSPKMEQRRALEGAAA
jgi:hypothetical protein